MAEFEAYVKKRNPDQADHDDIMKEFKKIDISGDGYIQFLEFLRAVCKKNDVYMHKQLDSFEKVQIFELIEYRHIADKDRKKLSEEVAQLYDNINPSGKT